MFSGLELTLTKHGERGYCYDHPDVVAGTKAQVVDRAVTQLLAALQTNGFELDGNILKRGNGWLRYADDAWQYSNDAGEAWQELGVAATLANQIEIAGGGESPPIYVRNNPATSRPEWSVAPDTGWQELVSLYEGLIPSQYLPTATAAALPFVELPAASPDHAVLFASLDGGIGRVSVMWPNGTVSVLGARQAYATVLLIRSDSTNNSDGFADASNFAHAITPHGGICHATGWNGFGATSIVCNGSTDYLSIADNAVWDFEDQDFTVEARVKLQAVQAQCVLCYYSTDLGGGWVMSIDASGKLFATFYDGIQWGLIGGTQQIDTIAWHHVAFARSGNLFRVYLDGVASVVTLTSTRSLQQTDTNVPLLVGASRASSVHEFFNGGIEEVRISKGVARWTENFTPPTIMFAE